MNAFEYARPTTLADVGTKLRASADYKLLAGGQSLLPAMKLGLAAPETLIDLGAIADLVGITVDAQSVTIKAMTTHAAVAAHAGVAKAIPALAQLAGGIGDRQVRYRGTIGGSLANSDPAACWPAAVLALGATITTDEREIAADDFFKGLYETALHEGEIITAVRFPVAQGAAYEKFKQQASRFSLVGVFVAKSVSGPRVAVTGAGACAFRAKSIEAALAKNFTPDAAGNVVVSADGLNNDLHGSAEYRAHLIAVLAQRAVARILG